MRILHQRVILQDTFPVLVVLPVGRALAKELLDSDLVAVEVLKDQVVEVRGLILLAEFDFYVRLAWPLRLQTLLIRYVAVSLYYVKLRVFT